ncbi:hypothetical protein REPUB_Repub03eG0088600 [Reevesia pubescens]
MKLYTNIYVFKIFLLLSFFRSSEANSVAFNLNIPPIPVNACAIVNCGQGTCQEKDGGLFGFECDCYSGWKKFQIGSIVLPPCIIPNCTLNFGCGAGSPSPPPSPSSPSFNLSDPCTFTWCGDGSCKTNGSGYECDCNAGADNLLDKAALPCFNECSLGADCQGLLLGPPPPSPSDSNPSPPTSDSNSSPPELLSSSHGCYSLDFYFTNHNIVSVVIISNSTFVKLV